MIKAIFFDLDGTLLPMSEATFTHTYFSLLAEKMSKHGYQREQLIPAIWEATRAMLLNDGKASNAEVFWEHFSRLLGDHVQNDIAIFEDFYQHEFKQLAAVCRPNPYAREIVDYVKAHFPLVVLTTNPLFPLVANQTRLGFVNLLVEDFDAITCYDNSRFCKPNPAYFTDLLTKFKLKPEEVILFGNSYREDAWCAEQVGIKCYLIGTDLITHPSVEKEYPVLAYTEVISLLKTLHE